MEGKRSLTNVPWHYNTLYLFSLNKDVIKNKFHFYVLARPERKRFMAHSNWPLTFAVRESNTFLVGCQPRSPGAQELSSLPAHQLPATSCHIAYSIYSNARPTGSIYCLDDANADAQFQEDEDDCTRH